MSLIADALKAAQRERGGASDLRRATAESVLRSPPVRNEAFAGVPLGRSSPLRWAAIALGGAFILTAGLIYFGADDGETPRPAGDPTAGQLPDPATTGRLDPEELPFLANLDPGPLSAPSPGDPTLENPGDAAGAGAGDGPIGSGSEDEGVSSGAGVASPPLSGAARTATEGPPPEAAGRPSASGSNIPTGGASPGPSTSRPSTVINGRFELSVANSAMAIDDRMAEAVAAQRAGDMSGAVVLYEQILAQRPDHVEARNNLGIALHSRGDLAGARDAFRTALAIDPGNANAWSNLGAVLSRLGEMDEAQAALGEASRLDPANLGAKVNLANLLLTRGLAADSRLLLAEVLQRDPGHAEANYAMGKTLDSMGDRPGAVRYYHAFLTYGASRFPSLDGPVRLRIQQLTER